MSTLKELWYGNIKPNEDKIITDEEKKIGWADSKTPRTIIFLPKK